jgi:NAD(P)H dehydrogenase (quinone)
MNVSIILAHPHAESLNHSIAATAAQQIRNNGHVVSSHDLYAEQFDPLLYSEEFPKSAALPQAIKTHCKEIGQADGIVVVHPNWSGQPPAILKGWIDRVMRPGVAYEFLEGNGGEGIPRGLLKARVAVVLNTSNTLPETERQLYGDPLETIWRNCVFGLAGVGTFYRRTFGVVLTSTDLERAQWLGEVRTLMDGIFPAAEGA